MRRCICTVAIGDSRLYQICVESQKNYAKRIEVDFILIDKSLEVYSQHLYLNKLRAFELLYDFDEVLYLDADVFVRSNSMNIFTAHQNHDFDLLALNESAFRDTDFPVRVFKGLERRASRPWPKDHSGNFIYYNTGVLLLRQRSILILDAFRIDEFFSLERLKLIYEQTYFNWLLVRLNMKVENLSNEFNHMFFTDWYNKVNVSFIHFADINKVYGTDSVFDIEKYEANNSLKRDTPNQFIPVGRVTYYRSRNKLLRVTKSTDGIIALFIQFSTIQLKANIFIDLTYNGYQIKPLEDGVLINKTLFSKTNWLRFYLNYLPQRVIYFLNLNLHYGLVYRTLRQVKSYLWYVGNCSKLLLRLSEITDKKNGDFYGYETNLLPRLYLIRSAIAQNGINLNKPVIQILHSSVPVSTDYIVKNQDSFIPQLLGIYEVEAIEFLKRELLGKCLCFIFDDTAFLHKVVVSLNKSEENEIAIRNMKSMTDFTPIHFNEFKGYKIFVLSFDADKSLELLSKVPKSPVGCKNLLRMRNEDYDLSRLSESGNDSYIIDRKSRYSILNEMGNRYYSRFEHNYICIPQDDYDTYSWLLCSS